MLSRRDFLTLALGVLVPRPLAAAPVEVRRGTYEADVGILYDVLSFRLAGTIEERIDREAGRYEVRVRGQGTGIQNAVDSVGILKDGRWAPARTTSYFVVYGRESQVQAIYDHAAGTIDYRSRSETFFLRRLRVAEDVVPIPRGTHVDDAASATLNYADGLWMPGAEGTLRTHVVRRRRARNEASDEVERLYRAELVPFDLRVARDAESGHPTALFDISRFSAWARDDRPARIVFGPDRRPLQISATLILGPSVLIRLAAA
jgi:hypothetical protein